MQFMLFENYNKIKSQVRDQAINTFFFEDYDKEYPKIIFKWNGA